MLVTLFLSLFTFTLLLGVIPIAGKGGFQTQIFSSWVFIGLNSIIVLMLLIYSIKRIRRNKILALAHLSLVCIAVSAFLYWQNRLETEPFRLNYKIPSYRLAGAYLINSNPHEQSELKAFGFTIGCSHFEREAYEPDYEWYEMTYPKEVELASHMQMRPKTKKVYTSRLMDNGIEYGKHAFTKSELLNVDSSYKKYIQVTPSLGVALSQKDKDYTAVIEISAQKDSVLLKPNSPVTVGDWQFFLLDYDESNIIINGVYDPIRLYFTLSLWFFMICCCLASVRAFYQQMRRF